MSEYSRYITVKLGKEKVSISRQVFAQLLDVANVQSLADYQHAWNTGEISFKDLKDLARRASAPYSLFFASLDVIKVHKKDKDKNLIEKLPSKNEMQLTARGGLRLNQIELIVKDLGRKQEFMKNRVVPGTIENGFIGLVAKKIKQRGTDEQIAEDIREYLGINLAVMRHGSKSHVLDYLVRKVEDKNILVSFSSYNYMPQNLSRDVGFSGICIKDKKFPVVFINTRDGDESPVILETSGRQIFSLCSMLVCIAMNKFLLNTAKASHSSADLRRVYAIAGELLIPKRELVSLEISYIDDLKSAAQMFRVTPSMLLTRLKQLNLIDPTLYKLLKSKLQRELEDAVPPQLSSPLPKNGYAKYNGSRLSREVLGAYERGAVSFTEVKNILFLRKRMDDNLFQEYREKFRRV